MEKSRRLFLKSVLSGGVGLSFVNDAFGNSYKQEEVVKLTILHTNDTHSHIDPFEENDSKYPNLGGVKRRAALVNSIRNENENTLLLDAGDIFQGTPYFNLYGGELELRLMSQMGYDAATMGNHDFDNGIDGFLKVKHNANFPFICSNYDFSNTLLKDKILKFKIFRKAGIKIGVFGLGVELKGLVDSRLYGNTKYLNPVDVANEYARELKHTHQCDLIICLSHLGYSYNEDKISDVNLVKLTRNIDLVIGGHTHTFLEKAEVHKNIENKDVLINQVGWAGIKLGRIDFFFNKLTKKQIKNVTNSTSLDV